jgi:hypothetical protein
MNAIFIVVLLVFRIHRNLLWERGLPAINDNAVDLTRRSAWIEGVRWIATQAASKQVPSPIISISSLKPFLDCGCFDSQYHLIMNIII